MCHKMLLPSWFSNCPELPSPQQNSVRDLPSTEKNLATPLVTTLSIVLPYGQQEVEQGLSRQRDEVDNNRSVRVKLDEISAR